MRQTPRRFLLGLAAALGAFCLVALWLRLHHAVADLSPTTPIFSKVWSLPTASFQAAALSPNGSALALISGQDNTLSFWNWQAKPDQPAWSRKNVQADSVAIGADGDDILAWASLSPNQPNLFLLRGVDGATLAQRTLNGAIWDVQVSPDGLSAGVTTGAKSFYLFTLDDRLRSHRWALGGYGNSADFTTAGSYLVTGTWDESSVSCYTLDGVGLWQYPETPEGRQSLSNRLFQAQFSGNGRYVLGLSYANARQGDPALYLWRTEGGGKLLWKNELGDDAFYPQAGITDDGQEIAVSYLRQVTHGEQTLAERRLRLLDTNGHILWERGGLLFSPILIALAPDGQRIIVSDGQRTLYGLNSDGRIMANYGLPGIIRKTVVSADGRFLLVYTGDGTLTLFRI